MPFDYCNICGKPIYLGASGLVYTCSHKELDTEYDRIYIEKHKKPFWKIW